MRLDRSFSGDLHGKFLKILKLTQRKMMQTYTTNTPGTDIKLYASKNVPTEFSVAQTYFISKKECLFLILLRIRPSALHSELTGRTSGCPFPSALQLCKSRRLDCPENVGY